MTKTTASKQKQQKNTMNIVIVNFNKEIHI